MNETETEIFVPVFLVILGMPYINIDLSSKQTSQKYNIN